MAVTCEYDKQNDTSRVIAISIQPRMRAQVAVLVKTRIRA